MNRGFFTTPPVGLITQQNASPAEDVCNNLSTKSVNELENIYKQKGCDSFFKKNTDCCIKIANNRRSKKNGLTTSDFFMDNVNVTDNDENLINDNRQCSIKNFPDGFIDKLSEFGVEYKYKQCCLPLGYGIGCQKLLAKKNEFTHERNKSKNILNRVQSLDPKFNPDVQEDIEDIENNPELTRKEKELQKKFLNLPGRSYNDEDSEEEDNDTNAANSTNRASTDTIDMQRPYSLKTTQVEGPNEGGKFRKSRKSRNTKKSKKSKRYRKTKKAKKNRKTRKTRK